MGDVDNGFFFPATLLTELSDDMLTVCEETFGPILAVEKVANAEQALEEQYVCLEQVEY